MHLASIDPFEPATELLRRAADLLRSGGLVAFPTETVYGLGANALDAGAVERIFAVKRRPPRNPLIVHVADAAGAKRYASAWPEAAERLAAAFWPGPLTLVLPKRPEVPDIVTAGLDTVGLRVPSHPVALALLREADLPVAAPSANRSTQLSPTTAEHVAKGLGDAVDLILDGGPTSVGIESTVVDLSGSRPALLRPGAISRDELESIVQSVDAPAGRDEAAAAPRSPGLLGRHYAPRAELRLFDADGRADAVEIAREAVASGSTVGALLLHPFDAPVQHPLVMPEQPSEYARRLYAALHSLDDLECSVILAELPPDQPGWAAVRDRLRRAAL